MKSGMMKPTGELVGDSGDMPNRGSDTGVTDTYGADIGQSSTNERGQITGSTKSDRGDLHVGRAEKI